MDNGEMRLQGLIRPEDEPSEEELDTLQEELLADAADPNSPSWSVAVGRRVIRPDELLTVDFSLGLDAPFIITPTEERMRMAERLRRLFWFIFN